MRVVAIALSLVLAILGMSASPRTARASELPLPGGTLDARGPDGEVLGGCPLERTEVSSQISGFVARVIVKQTFRNPFPDPIEAVYTFPLSERGAIDGMWIRTGGREIRGEIRRREEALEMYERARADGKLAALLDEERRNVFTQRVANLMPGAEVEIEIRYVETLAYEDGSFSWSFPTVVGPRFVPGQATGRSGTGRIPDTTRVPDASRITPPVAPEGTRAGHDIGIEVSIDAGVSIESIASLLHEVEIERDGERRALVRLASRDEIPNRDFVLRWKVAGEQVKSGFLTHRSGGDGYVTLILIPPERVTPQSAAPKELIFVIDRSGSQSGLPLLKAKETMLWTLEHLNPNDTFQIVSFSNRTEKLFARPELATPDSLRRAREYVRRLEANGGTMMAEAVREVCATPAADNRLRVVTFMTDGYVGNDYEVIDLVKRLRGRSRWFPFGTGNSVNRFLLDQMAAQGGGEVEYVLLNEDGEKVARSFWERIASPVLTDVTLDFRGVDVEHVYPYEVSDLWAQKPLIVHARYRQAGSGSVLLRGFRGGQPWSQRLDLDLPGQNAENAGIASIWARARVDDLLARDLSALQSGSYPDSLKREIVTVALAHDLLTPFTSFIAVEDRVINENGSSRTVTVPVELPHGVDRRGALGESDEQRGLMGKGMPYKRALSSAGRMAQNMPATSGVLSRRERADALQEQPAPVGIRKPALLAKLGPELRKLVEGHAAPAAHPRPYSSDGTLTVRVKTTGRARDVVEALEAAGLRVTLTTEHEAVGAITLETLETLLRLDVVERVSLR